LAITTHYSQCFGAEKVLAYPSAIRIISSKPYQAPRMRKFALLNPTTDRKERPCMAQELPAIHFEDIPLAEARTMGRGPRMDPELYHAFKEKIPDSPGFSGKF
jgi:hypothetical protein